MGLLDFLFGKKSGTCILGGDCEWDDMAYPNCHRAKECKEHQDYLNSPEKAESDRRDAANSARIQEALDRGEIPDPPF